jgi:hypothetical protein
MKSIQHRGLFRLKLKLSL